MTDNELRAIVSLLDDEDDEVLKMIEDKIFSLGEQIIPFLEDEWSRQFNPVVQRRIEQLLHTINYNFVKKRLLDWSINEENDLLKGMWIIATYQYPDLQLDELRKQIDQLYYDAWSEMKTDLIALDQIKLLNSIFFNRFRFRANTANIKAVSNSMLNNILESKKSNPIGLCIVYMFIAQRLNLPVYGVNLPNIFILTYKTDKVQFYINVFNKGLTFIKNDIDNYILQLGINPRPIFYEPCSNLDIIKRVLRNLIAAYEDIGEKVKVEEIQHLLDNLPQDNL
ncbi:MAG: transglutaminase-like domain-containing protein [Thermoflexibacter sp.]|jgi:regulator of sirC expression with transglutaminase-like and TPR domain|nr:transglutaminase-like domain-containing protein [Thermoflexibacter sp.]